MTSENGAKKSSVGTPVPGSRARHGMGDSWFASGQARPPRLCWLSDSPSDWWSSTAWPMPDRGGCPHVYQIWKQPPRRASICCDLTGRRCRALPACAWRAWKCRSLALPAGDIDPHALARPSVFLAIACSRTSTWILLTSVLGAPSSCRTRRQLGGKCWRMPEVSRHRICVRKQRANLEAAGLPRSRPLPQRSLAPRNNGFARQIFRRTFPFDL